MGSPMPSVSPMSQGIFPAPLKGVATGNGATVTVVTDGAATEASALYEEKGA